MIFQVMVVYDSKARSHLMPMFVVHVEVGQRGFADAANDPTTVIGRNPEDFSLFHIGEWDDEIAEMKPFESRRAMGLAASYQRPTHV